MDEFVQERGGSLGVDDLVELTHGLFRMPSHAHLTTRVTGFQQAQQSRLAGRVESFVALGQQTAAAVERVMLVTAMFDMWVSWRQ